MKRRKFLASSLALPATLGLPSTFLLAASQDPKMASSQDDFAERRKRLLNEAHFGKKSGVSSKKGIAMAKKDAKKSGKKLVMKKMAMKKMGKKK